MTACIVHDWGQVAKGLIVLAAIVIGTGIVVLHVEQERAARRRRARSRWLLALTPERRHRYETGGDDL